MRLVGRPLEVYQYLEPLFNDYRKIRLQNSEGNFVLTHVDELVDEMLRKDFLFDIALPRVPARCVCMHVCLLHQHGEPAWVNGRGACPITVFFQLRDCSQAVLPKGWKAQQGILACTDACNAHLYPC